MTRPFQFRIGLALALIGWVACQPSDSTNARPVSRDQSERQGAQAAPLRDLSQDEAAGGHVLRKHVGRTDDELRQRLEQEPNISGASTYTDRPTAERVIGTALAQSQDRLQRWLSRSGSHPNLVLDYDSDQPIGRTMNRGDHQSRPCAHALVVLKYDPPDRYHVLTSYPECR
jgi:Bacterial CdiA-CT RNAse A domain